MNKRILVRPDKVFVPFMHRDGGVWVNSRIIDPAQQFFSHLDEEGIWRHFHIATLLAMVREAPNLFDALTVKVTKEHADIVLHRHGIDQGYVDRLWGTPRLNDPGIFCLMPDDTQILVDGNHRFVARFRAGLPTMAFWGMTEAQCRPAMLAIPEAWASVL